MRLQRRVLRLLAAGSIVMVFPLAAVAHGLEIETAPDTYLYASDPTLALPAAPILQELSITLGNLLAKSFIH